MLNSNNSKSLKILKWPHIVLESKAAVISDFDDELKKLAADMHETMKTGNGIGLAANQVGVLKRIITIHIPYCEADESNNIKKKWWHDKVMTLVNPEIISYHQDKSRFYEGCLSFPSIFDYVERVSEIGVKAYDVDGKPMTFEADGLFACCLQHEIDHLDGVVFFKRMSRHKARRVKLKVHKRKESLPSQP